MKRFMILFSLFFIAEASSQEDVSERDLGKGLIRQWIKTEKQLSEEQDSWKQEKAHTSELLIMFKKELKLLNEELAAVQSVELDGQKQVQLEKQIIKADEERRQLRKFLIRLKPRVLAMVEDFPQPLQDELSVTVNDLSGSDDDTSTRDFLMSILNVLEAGNSFNAGVYRTSQTVQIGEDKWQAEVMYLGLSRAYFWVGNKAGIGSPSRTQGVKGWKWERDDEQLEEIKKAMSIFDKKTQPELIKLPLKLN